MGDNPDEHRICTSHVERLNLTVRMNLRRFTRLTNGHSKSLKHDVAMQALLFAWYNFCRVHTTIKATPAMASGLVDRAWSLRDLLEAAAEAYARSKTQWQAQDDDWRLWGQEKDIRGNVLHWSRYTQPSATWDHDHCEFCFQRFAEPEAGYSDSQSHGYTT